MKKIIISIVLIFSVSFIALIAEKSISITGIHSEESTNADALEPLSDEVSLAFKAKYDFVKMSSGKDHALFLDSNGVVYAKGDNSLGQLGIGQGQSSSGLVKVSDSATGDTYRFVNDGQTDRAVDIAAGYQHSIVLTESGKIFAFGVNSSYQSGVSTSTAANYIPKFAFEKGWYGVDGKIVEVAAGTTHTIFRTANNCIYGMGKGSSGQLGDGKSGGAYIATYKPVKVSDNAYFDYYNCQTEVVKIAAYSYNSMFLTKAGNVLIYGDNQWGQLGIPINEGLRSKPTKPWSTEFNNVGVKDIFVGGQSAYVIDANGIVYAAGYNLHGSLCTGTATGQGLETFKKLPNTASFTNGGMKKIKTGSSVTLIQGEDNSMYSCGYNQNGQLGLGHQNHPVTTAQKVQSSGVYANGTTVISDFGSAGTDILFLTGTKEILVVSGGQTNLFDAGGFDAEVTGNGINDNSGVIKYNTGVTINAGSNLEVFVKLKDAADFTKLTYTNGTYKIGEISGSASSFDVASGEEKTYIIKIQDKNAPDNSIENEIVIDKKPPTFAETAVGDKLCNAPIDGNTYCNINAHFELIDDSGFYQIERKNADGTFTDLTESYNSNGGKLHLEITTPDSEYIDTFIITDGAGNRSEVEVYVDNYAPRVTLK